MNEQIKRIGLVGVGNMGRCMMLAILNAGYDICIYDPSEQAQTFASQYGVKVCSFPNEIAQAQLILLSLPEPRHIKEVLSNEYGLLTSLKNSQIIVNTSTVDPQTNIDAAKCVEKKGVYFIDAPILGRPSAVGNWLLPAGGDIEAIKRAEKVLLSFAKKVVPVGAVGVGSTIKLLNQLMFSVINGITAEVMTLAETMGISKTLLYETLAQSGAATISGLFKEVGKCITQDSYDNPTFSMELLCKDAGLGIAMANAKGVSPHIAQYVQKLNVKARDEGLASQDSSALFKYLKAINDVQIN